ncbi:MAG: UbiA family prenyltransferase [Chloroflexi bacterium]|nr:UbiA family prenyltransferase [Chloroflexota bacterium]
MGIIHPFPTTLVSGLVAVLATLAGGTPNVVTMLALAMFGFQASIGATNDLADLPRDRQLGSRKPLPARQLTVRAARGVALMGGTVGLVLSALLGPGVLIVGCAGYGCGIAYDLWLRQRALAWLAYSAAFPLLLVYVWLGAVATLPPSWQALLPMAVAIGPALHLSNSMVDVDTDHGDPAGGLSGHLGRTRAIAVLAALLTVVYVFAWATLLLTGREADMDAGAPVARLAAAGIFLATSAALVGLVLSTSRGRGRRMFGWAVQAVATALLGIAWIGAVAA